MKISIITAVYNRERTVAQAIESVVKQSHPEVEHLIIDGASTDGTLEEVHRRSHPGLRLISEPDRGIYDAVNKGIALAGGDIIGLMHSDDIFASSDVLEKVAATFRISDVDGVYGDLQYVSSSDTNRLIRHWRSGEYSRERLVRGWMPPHPTLYLRREVFDRWGSYDTEFRIAADYEAMLRWLVRGNIRLGYIPEVLVKMRVGGESNRSLGRILLKSQEDLRAIRRHKIGGVRTLMSKNFSKLGQFRVGNTTEK